MEPTVSFQAQFVEEVRWYERVRAGDLSPIHNLNRLGQILIGLSRSAGVWLGRYLSTNAATPLSVSARATFQPSFSIDSVRKPPPGATITAAPVAFDGSGRNGRRVATVTFRANRLPYWLCHDGMYVQVSR